jgi:type II secretion system protein N
MHATRLRFVFLFLLAPAACGRSEPAPVATGAFELDDVVVTRADALRISVNRREVPVEQVLAKHLPRGAAIVGLADVALDVTIPRSEGSNHYRDARGSIALSCAHCRFDTIKMIVQTATSKVTFGKLDLGRVEIHAGIEDGVLRLERGTIDSNDITVRSALTIRFADQIEKSSLDGCVRFKPDPGLARREPDTHAALQTTGATLGPDGFYSMKIGGTLGDYQLIGAPC